MAAQWVKYDGSEKQIAEMRNAKHGWIVKYVDTDEMCIAQSEICYLEPQDKEVIKEYLICDPHPYADMVCQWARTGQPVWVRYAKVCHFGQTSEYEICNQIATTTPDWNIPGAEYSFEPFEEEV